MKFSLGNVSLALTLISLAPAGGAQPAVTTACSSLSALQLPELDALEAVWIDAQPMNPGLRSIADESGPLPSHCRVRGRVQTAINFEVLLPAAADWNGRFLALGNESADGIIPAEPLESALRAGYAVAATDGGHAGSGPGWLTDDARLRDFSYRAVYETSVKSQAIIAEFYLRPASYRYFEGCSVGGQQGLMQAEHFPELFDGIVAGAPLTNFTATQATSIWAAQTVRSTTGQPLLGPQQLQLLNNAVMAQCDTLDGVADGVLEDPRRCNFDPGRLQCGTGSAGACLNPGQVEAARAIYAGPSTGLRSGRSPAPVQPRFTPGPASSNSAQDLGMVIRTFDLPGYLPGSEPGWQFAVDQTPASLALDFFRYAVMSDAGWNWREFNLGTDLTLALDDSGWILDLTAGELSRFGALGGKLIAYHGWNDSISAPEATIAYFEQAVAGGASAYTRLFMIPGMQHCGGGTGTDDFSMLRALEDWVERGIAPDRIEATRILDETPVRTRPLCPYPQTARYRGTGSSDQSGNFVCTN
jgi:feruloyl esterase